MPTGIDPNLLNLLQSLKPFLSAKAKNLAEATEAVAELMDTESANKMKLAIQGLRKNKKVENIDEETP